MLRRVSGDGKFRPSRTLEITEHFHTEEKTSHLERCTTESNYLSSPQIAQQFNELIDPPSIHRAPPPSPKLATLFHHVPRRTWFRPLKRPMSMGRVIRFRRRILHGCMSLHNREQGRGSVANADEIGNRRIPMARHQRLQKQSL